jgi:hypothetical protein
VKRAVSLDILSAKGCPLGVLYGVEPRDKGRLIGGESLYSWQGDQGNEICEKVIKIKVIGLAI